MSWSLVEELPGALARVRCTCGRERTVRTRDLRSGRTRRCSSCASTIHGHCAGGRSATYESWRCMISRCTRPDDPSWRWYGERGVQVCERWQRSFAAFLADVGERPDEHTLDRIDPEGHYEPGNVRWATAAEQRANQRESDPAEFYDEGCVYA